MGLPSSSPRPRDTILLTRYWSASSVCPFLPMIRPVSAPFTSRVMRSSSSVATTSCSTSILSSSVRKTSAALSLFDISGPRRLSRHLRRLRLVTVHPPLLQHGQQSVGENIDGQPRRQE